MPAFLIMKIYNIPIDICLKTYYNRIINSEVMTIMKEMLMQLHEMINAGSEEEKTSLLKIFARGLGKLAAEGSADARYDILSEMQRQTDGNL